MEIAVNDNWFFPAGKEIVYELFASSGSFLEDPSAFSFYQVFVFGTEDYFNVPLESLVPRKKRVLSGKSRTRWATVDSGQQGSPLLCHMKSMRSRLSFVG